MCIYILLACTTLERPPGTASPIPLLSSLSDCLTNFSSANTTEEQLQKLLPQSQQHPEKLTLNNVNLPAQSLSGDEVYYLVELCLRFQYILLHPGPPCSMICTNPLSTKWPRRTFIFSLSQN